MKTGAASSFCCLLILGIAAFDLSVHAVTPDDPNRSDIQHHKLYADEPPGEATWDKDGPIPEMQIDERGSYRFVHEPVLDVYHATGENRSGSAVVICPGGAYTHLAYEHEGIQVAKWLNSHGITGVILRYRMHPYRHPVPMMDVQRALQTVRANSTRWSLDPERIGVLGFSAGGHLASTATVHHAEADRSSDDPVLRVSSRPDFSVLVYPVISLRPPVAHMGSRRKLLGPDPTDELLDLMSTDKQVNKQTPPTLLVHSEDDKAVPIGNSELFFAAMKQHDVPGKLLVYKAGGHGYGLGRKDTDSMDWPQACIDWFAEIGVLQQAEVE